MNAGRYRLEDSGQRGARARRPGAARQAPAVILSLLAGIGAAQAHGTEATPVPASRVTAETAPPARILLVVRHETRQGRIIVSVGGHTVFSAPLTALDRAGRQSYQRPLSVESGRQAIAVQVIDTAGRVVARQERLETLDAEGSAVLEVAEHPGEDGGLTLEWRTP
jgi:hypothetical protein